ncbi:MAG: hypothetical protein L7T26_01785 [Pseudomonadales bacterium]|nr:hypothetical protein [Pseudomonadales bacterium]
MLSVIYILVINVVSYAGSGCVHIKDTETLIDCFEGIPLRLGGAELLGSAEFLEASHPCLFHRDRRSMQTI